MSASRERANSPPSSILHDYRTCLSKFIRGYHGVTGFPLPLQTYSTSDFDSTGLFTDASGRPISDTTTASHEVDEWMDDPFIVNEVTPWGNIGQVSGCTNIL
jgi:hypothetical protein